MNVVNLFIGKDGHQMKKTLMALSDTREAVTNEEYGGAYVEGVALKLFAYAEREDNQGQFHKCAGNFHDINIYSFYC